MAGRKKKFLIRHQNLPIILQKLEEIYGNPVGGIRTSKDEDNIQILEMEKITPEEAEASNLEHELRLSGYIK